MNRQRMLHLAIAITLLVLSMAGCGGAPAAAPAPTVPTVAATAPAAPATATPEPPKATLTPAATPTLSMLQQRLTRQPTVTATVPVATPSLTERVKLDDITMYYAVYGAGEPLILLHGGMSSAESFSRQVTEFAKHYRVITPDSRGQGRTTDSDAPLSYHLMAEDMLRLMDYLKLDSARIVGWSDGGIIGLDMAIHHPERVKALVAFGANTNPDGFKPSMLAYVRDTKTEALQADLGAEYRQLSSTPEHLPVIIEKVRNLWLTEPNFTAADLATITSPTLILDGDWEEVIRIDHVKEFAQAIPGAELILMPGTGHYAPYEKAVEFNKIVLDFLKDK